MSGGQVAAHNTAVVARHKIVVFIHGDINPLRELASRSRGARHPRVLFVHSGACAPGFSNVSPLATISIPMLDPYPTNHTEIACPCLRADISIAGFLFPDEFNNAGGHIGYGGYHVGLA